ncbi:aminobenzoyl-glutamate utilization protein B [Sphingomonas jinjuensis]|uniref:Aminobenzoyl-glutamate utilization protein B n=1 Tax=Sphingomonas jinjuensis TaxID=535907 RepID=A0A840FCY2_9SPHN|nr:amidohydrolase [Sphingomonas jinjuensis]MBB4153614.1 aminobenzoyl-glutamate utilization protein B [Sphingomonas jinjuensis]
MHRPTIAIAIALLAATPAAAQLAQPERAAILADVDTRSPDLARTALAIWNAAEVGYQETKSSALLQTELKRAGFTVTPGVAGMPTAFVASFKRGTGPVIGILAEYDALPGLAQRAEPKRDAIAGQAAGHGCGHNIFGAASVTAAIAVKDWMVANKIDGEVRLYGSPAEEGGSGKVYLVRAGLFDDVDAVLHWHPSDSNGVSTGASQANISGKFRFHGLSAHASAAPDKGRSALDGVEVMNVAVNYLREHIPMTTRIHYVVTNGGEAPNVVPDFAESYYYVRHTDPQVVRDVMARVQKAAEGAAIATGTTSEFEATGGVYSMLASETLAKVMDANLHAVGGPRWTADETAWASGLRTTLATKRPLDSAAKVQAISDADGGGSTDVSDVSWVVPTIGLGAATWVPGTPAHSWQAVAASGFSIGAKGGTVAAKTIALTAAELMRSPQTLAAAKAELFRRRGAGFTYKAMLGDRKPPLDYRAPSAPTRQGS